MFSVATLAAIAALGVGIWFWSESLRSREQALRTCADVCRQMDVQLLDQTVAVWKLGIGRDGNGRLRVRRYYLFEFSIDGVERHRGHAVLLGRSLEYVEMEHPDGSIIQGPRVRANKQAGRLEA